MKRIIAIVALLILIACQPQAPQVEPTPQSRAQPPAWLLTGYATPAVEPQIADKPPIPELGSVALNIYAYGAKDVGGSVNAGTPLDYRINVAQATAGSPPLTNAYAPTILLTVIYSDGRYELYGTEDVPKVLASNKIMYDPNLGRWVTEKGLSQGQIGIQNFVLLVNWNGKTKVVEESVKVR
ncbi:hypothetical protein HY489_05020 [Candidatus Woesearchaeota archaeon]|nr:hypothetical protein [Candidatus Woesearchaeota archaeon]